MRIASKLNEKAVKTQLRDFSGVRRGRRQWQKGALNQGGDSIIFISLSYRRILLSSLLLQTSKNQGFFCAIYRGCPRDFAGA